MIFRRGGGRACAPVTPLDLPLTRVECPGYQGVQVSLLRNFVVGSMERSTNSLSSVKIEFKNIYTV